MGKIEAVLFDMDGVLIDSKEASFAWISANMVAYGYPKPKKEDYEAAFSMDRHDTIKHLTKETSEKELKKMLDFAKSRESSYPVELVKLYDGEVEVIGALSKKYKLGIVTNGSKSSVERFFSNVGVGKYFRTVVAREDTRLPKPDPEPLRIAAIRLDVNPKRMVYIGDRDVDVVAGHAARMKVIAFSKDRVGGADVNVQKFREIPKAVSKLETGLF